VVAANRGGRALLHDRPVVGLRLEELVDAGLGEAFSVVREVYRLLAESKRAADLPTGVLDTTPFGLEANRRNLEVAIDCVYRQRLIPRRFAVDELFDDVTRGLGAT